MATSGHTQSLDQLKLVVLMVVWNLETPANQLIAEELLLPTEYCLPN